MLFFLNFLIIFFFNKKSYENKKYWFNFFYYIILYFIGLLKNLIILNYRKLFISIHNMLKKKKKLKKLSFLVTKKYMIFFLKKKKNFFIFSRSLNVNNYFLKYFCSNNSFSFWKLFFLFIISYVGMNFLKLYNFMYLKDKNINFYHLAGNFFFITHRYKAFGYYYVKSILYSKKYSLLNIKHGNNFSNKKRFMLKALYENLFTKIKKRLILIKKIFKIYFKYFFNFSKKIFLYRLIFFKLYKVGRILNMNSKMKHFRICSFKSFIFYNGYYEIFFLLNYIFSKNGGYINNLISFLFLQKMNPVKDIFLLQNTMIYKEKTVDRGRFFIFEETSSELNHKMSKFIRLFSTNFDILWFNSNSLLDNIYYPNYLTFMWLNYKYFLNSWKIISFYLRRFFFFFLSYNIISLSIFNKNIFFDCFSLIVNLYKTFVNIISNILLVNKSFFSITKTIITNDFFEDSNLFFFIKDNASRTSFLKNLYIQKFWGFFKKLEESINSYTNDNCYFLINFNYQKRYCINSAKMLCDEVLFALKRGIHIKRVFQLVKKKQDYEFKLKDLESGTGNINLKILQSYKFPLKGIRFVYSGNIKKAKRKQKIRYHLWISNIRYHGPLSTNTLKRYVDYHFHSAKLRNAVVGIKIWLLFFTD